MAPTPGSNPLRRCPASRSSASSTMVWPAFFPKAPCRHLGGRRGTAGLRTPTRRGEPAMAIVTGQRDVPFSGRVVPFVTTLVFALISLVPLHLPGFAVITPAFSLMALYHWTVYRPNLLPPISVFVLGLVLDLLSGAPYVGLSAGIFLVARTVLLTNRP